MKFLILLSILLGLSLGASAQRLPVRPTLVPTSSSLRPPLPPMRKSLTETPSAPPKVLPIPPVSSDPSSPLVPDRGPAGIESGSRADVPPGVPPLHPTSGWLAPSRPPDPNESESSTSLRTSPENDSLWFVPSSAGTAGTAESERNATSRMAPDLPSMEGLRRRLLGEPAGGGRLPSLGSSPFRYPSALKGREGNLRMKPGAGAASMPTPSLPNSNSAAFAQRPWFSAYGTSPSEAQKESPLSKALSEANKMNLEPALDDSLGPNPIDRVVLPDLWLEQVGVMDPYLVKMLPYLMQRGRMYSPPDEESSEMNP